MAAGLTSCVSLVMNPTCPQQAARTIPRAAELRPCDAPTRYPRDRALRPVDLSFLSRNQNTQIVTTRVAPPELDVSPTDKPGRQERISEGSDGDVRTRTIIKIRKDGDATDLELWERVGGYQTSKRIRQSPAESLLGNPHPGCVRQRLQWHAGSGKSADNGCHVARSIVQPLRLGVSFCSKRSQIA